MHIEMPPKENLSPKSTKIWLSLNTSEQLYCKYFFMQDLSVSAIIAGVFSAYLVNVFTSISGVTFRNLFHILVYVTNVLASVCTFICVVNLYMVHVDNKQKNGTLNVARSHRVSLEFEYFEERRSEIAKNLRNFKICVAVLFVTLVMLCILNNLNAMLPTQSMP